ncbi:hypothetical protein EON81_02675 [bacterium]|nr:MAG: hypothetical protein EON81_02675 [bacterium]
MLAAILLLAAPAPAEVWITPTKPVFLSNEYVSFKVELKNLCQKPIEILEVGDGSAEHWVKPFIGWSVLRANEKAKHPEATPALHLARCGNVNPTVSEMFHPVAPGETRLILNGGGPLDFSREPGEYRIVFYYEIDPKAPTRMDEGLGGLPEGLLPRYKALTPMKLRSNEVRFKVMKETA